MGMGLAEFKSIKIEFDNSFFKSKIGLNEIKSTFSLKCFSIMLIKTLEDVHKSY